MTTGNVQAPQYWDSCVFITYLRNRAAEAEQVGVIRDLLRQATGGRILVVTSTLSLAEVRPYADRYDAEHMGVIEDLFHTNRPYFRLVAVTGAISRRARQLGEQHRALSVADSIHLATADMEPGVGDLFTYDGVREQGMRRSGQLTDLDNQIGNPALRIRAPFVDLGPLFRGGPQLPA